MTIIWCVVPEIWSTTDRIFCHSGPFFALLPPYGSRKSKLWKIEKTTRWYYHFTHVYHKCQSYDVWFLRYGVWQTEFSDILDCFLPFTTLKSQKIKILKKWKNDLETISFHTGVPKITNIWCMVPEISRVTDRIFCHFGLYIFCPFTINGNVP